MTLAFVTGCLAPGRDGVGDYSRDLAAACVARDRPCVLVALNDPHVESGARVEEAQAARGVELPTLRLSPALPWRDRISQAADWLRAHAVDTVSFQLVPFALQPKGLMLGFAGRFAALAAGRRVHVMMHELWVGATRDAPFRHRVLGVAQCAAVRDVLRSLAPAVLHTSNPAYVGLLTNAGFAARELPLCGSIPVASRDARWLGAALEEAGVAGARNEAPDRRWCFGFFGSIHPLSDPAPLLDAIESAAARRGARVVLASIGRQGPGEALWRSLAASQATRFGFAALGARSTDEISWFLQSIDAGIATTPWALIGKSATTAAMLDHGVPVIVARDDAQYPGVNLPPPSDPLLHRLGAATADWLAAGVPRRTPRDGLASLADRFLADLDGPAAVAGR